ncbi:Alpha-L-rhamnosidase [Aspergillus sp. HF37]|nr:Alpha-L-rhamnosidase [Aspergillus sp. HF37]
MRILSTSLFIAPALLGSACSGAPYDEYILAPSSRDLVPASVCQVNGSVTGAASVAHSSHGNVTFRGPSAVTYDFGRNIGGVVSLDVLSASSPDSFLGVTFTESSMWISNEACDATADSGRDSPLWFHAGQGPGQYTAERKHVRGAFRYLTVSSNTTATISVRSVHTHFTAAPSKELRAYTGYFHCNEDLINRIWYAGAYTNQLGTIDPAYGNSLVSETENVTLPETVPWWSNTTISNGSSVITDGAKRDRLVWPGDMSIALESIAVSTADLYSVRMGLESLFVLQTDDGQLPYVGSSPLGVAVSFTYHLHSLIGAFYYLRYSGDHHWIAGYWGQYKRGIRWAVSRVDDTGLANVTLSADWLRFGMGGHNIEANAILYYVLGQALELGQTLGDQADAEIWASVADGIKSAANQRLWDDGTGLYYDNETTTLHPQDGNSWAIKANLTRSNEHAMTISSSLRARWGPYGAPAPEAGKTVSPFIGGFELQAHYLSNQPGNALDLIRRQWGFMLTDPRMTHSTFIEGYSTDGSLHYAPYSNDPRISHAHGWSTGPTSALTFFAGGLHLTGPAGATWAVAPQPGNLTLVDTGFSTVRGAFSTTFRRIDGTYTEFTFTTPRGTTGEVRLPGTEGSLRSTNDERVELVNGSAAGLKGGTWKLSS